MKRRQTPFANAIEQLLRKPDVVVLYQGEDGTQRSVHLDRAYSNTLGLMHEDYLERVGPSGWTAPGFDVSVLAPVDLAISKLGRWAEHDRADVKSLIGGFLHSADGAGCRASDATA